MSKKDPGPQIIALNKKATFEYFIEQRFEAGIMLQGWEVKSLRAGKVQLVDSYVILKNSEVWLLGAHITPLLSASTHIEPNSTRTRKLLLRQAEINKLIGAVKRQGFTLIPIKLYWSKNKVKLEIALAKGKKLHDKRASAKEREQKREMSSHRKVG